MLQSGRAVFRLALNTWRIWSDAQAAQLAAALSFYAIFSLAPLLLLATTVGSYLFGPAAARGDLVVTLHLFVGKRVAEAIQAVLVSGRPAAVSASIFSALLLLYASSGVFRQLKLALNMIWGAQPSKRTHWLILIVTDRIFAAVATAAAIFFLIAAAVVTAVLATVERSLLPSHAFLLWRTLNFCISVVLLTALIVTIFRFVPDSRPRTASLWAGALMTATILSVGHILLAIYLARSSVVASYGAAGSLVVIVIWVYFTSLTIFFGAAFAKAEGSAPKRRRRAGK